LYFLKKKVIVEEQCHQQPQDIFHSGLFHLPGCWAVSFVREEQSTLHSTDLPILVCINYTYKDIFEWRVFNETEKQRIYACKKRVIVDHVEIKEKHHNI
jgi:hypothetical protein